MLFRPNGIVQLIGKDRQHIRSAFISEFSALIVNLGDGSREKSIKWVRDHFPVWLAEHAPEAPCKNRGKPAPDFGRKRQVISAESGT